MGTGTVGEALAETMGHRNKDMKVVKLVVFTNKNITLHNKCKELQTCFLGQLPYLIEDYEGADLYIEEDIAAMAEAVCSICYLLLWAAVISHTISGL